MAFEFDILYALQSWRTPFWDTVMSYITKLGDAGIFWILLSLALCVFKKTRKMGVCALCAMIFGVIVGNLALKNIVQRARPCWIDDTVKLLVEIPKDYSFPSGHTQASFAAATSFFLYNKKWGAAALVLAALIAFSRLYLFVHFPTDVLAGLILGVIFAFCARALVKWGEPKLLKKYRKHCRRQV